MADATYTIDTSDLVKAQTELKAWATENKKAIASIKADMTAESNIRNLSLKNAQAEAKARVSLNKQRQTAIAKTAREQAAAAKVIEAEAKKEAAAVQRLDNEYDKYRASIDDVYAAQLKYNKLSSVITQRNKAMGVSTEQTTVELEELRLKLAQVGVQMDSMGNVTSTVGRNFNQFGEVGQKSGKKMSQFNQQVQQGGYQLQDFVVQLQGGTSFFTAFAQQGSQFAGVFGPSGAVVGAVIALGSAIAGMAFNLSKSTEEAKTFKEEISTLGSTLGRLSDLRLEGLTDELAEGARLAKLEFINILTVMEQIELKALGQSLLAPYRSITEEMEKYIYQLNIASQLGSEIPEFTALGLNSLQEATFVATQFKTIQGETKEEIAAQIDLVTESLELRGVLTDEIKEQLAAMAEQVGVVDQIVEAQEYQNVVAEANRNLIEQIVSTVNDINFDVAISGAERLGDKLADAAGQAAAVMNRMIAFNDVDSGDFQNRLNLQAIYGQNADTRSAAPTTPVVHRPTRTSSSGGSSPGGSGSASKDYLAELQTELQARRELLSVSGEQRTMLEAVREVEKSLGDDRRKYNQAQIQGLANQIVELDKLEEAQKLAATELKNMYKEQESIIDGLTGSFSDSYNSIVDGTLTVKEAFRSMAVDVISQLHNILITQRLVGSFDAATGVGTGLAGALGGFFADGAAFNNGSVVPFANGGVVSSATMFPMSGGQTGVMGEAGPEAIMPLTRGPDGSLGVKAQGGGDSVTNITVNAQGAQIGVAEQIEQKLREVAPTLVNQSVSATKKSMRTTKSGWA